MDVQICSKCSLSYPITAFRLRNSQKGTRRRICKRCELAAQRQYRNQVPRPVFNDTETERRCSSCEKLYLATTDFFTRHGKGLSRTCKQCQAALRTEQKRPALTPEGKQQVNARGKHYRKLYPDRYREFTRTQQRALKQEMVNAYGGKCSCCGETELTFLTLEHVLRNGTEHRRRVGRGSVYRDLRRRGWPQEGYTIYCWNCQMATRYGSPCPHTTP